MNSVLALVAALSGAVGSGGQATAPVPLPDALRAHVKEERFELVTSIRGLPLGVREGLQILFGSPSLDIAEPGAKFQASEATATATSPTRRLIAAGCSNDHCFVYYERGGKDHTWHVALFHWTPAATKFEWGGLAPSGLTSVAAVQKAALSGAIKGPSHIY